MPHISRPDSARPKPWPGADDRVDGPEALPPDIPTRPPSTQEAADATGAVRIVVDARARVQSVSINPRWRDRLDADALLTALLETYYAARQLAVQATIRANRAARESGGQPVTSVDPAESPPRPGRPPDRTVDRGEWLRWLTDVRARTDAVMRQTTQLYATVGRSAHERAGPHGYLTAIIQGEVAEITGDARAIKYASTDHLEQDALAILSADRQPALGQQGNADAQH